MNYWRECISEALEDAGITASDAQIDTITKWVEGAHENHGMAYGYDHIDPPRETELDRVKKELEEEREKVGCDECRGLAFITIPGPGQRYSTTECWKCRGSGKIKRWQRGELP